MTLLLLTSVTFWPLFLHPAPSDHVITSPPCPSFPRISQGLSTAQKWRKSSVLFLGFKEEWPLLTVLRVWLRVSSPVLSFIDYTDSKAEGLISLMQQSQTLLTKVVDIMVLGSCLVNTIFVCVLRLRKLICLWTKQRPIISHTPRQHIHKTAFLKHRLYIRCQMWKCLLFKGY
jgi:hypothetical protein